MNWSIRSMTSRPSPVRWVRTSPSTWIPTRMTRSPSVSNRNTSRRSCPCASWAPASPPGWTRPPGAQESHPAASLRQGACLQLDGSCRAEQVPDERGEEGLAAELNLSGGNAWGKLQGTVTSQLSVDFELDGKLQKLPMPALINLRSHPDEDVRRRAYDAENKAWESVQETLAAVPERRQGRSDHAEQTPRTRRRAAFRPRHGAH